MSRPKVGVLPGSDAFIDSRGKEGSRGGIQDRGGPRGGIPYRVGENFEPGENFMNPEKRLKVLACRAPTEPLNKSKEPDSLAGNL